MPLIDRMCIYLYLSPSPYSRMYVQKFSHLFEVILRHFVTICLMTSSVLDYSSSKLRCTKISKWKILARIYWSYASYLKGNSFHNCEWLVCVLSDSSFLWIPSINRYNWHLKGFNWREVDTIFAAWFTSFKRHILLVSLNRHCLMHVECEEFTFSHEANGQLKIFCVKYSHMKKKYFVVKGLL